MVRRLKQGARQTAWALDLDLRDAGLYLGLGNRINRMIDNCGHQAFYADGGQRQLGVAEEKSVVMVATDGAPIPSNLWRSGRQQEQHERQSPMASGI
jgi:hypothetical protein